MKKKADKCLWCGKPAELLCDGHLGYPPTGAENNYKGLDLMRPFTCDAPLCTGCATRKMKYIVCRRGKGCEVDTVDHCPACAAREVQTPPVRPRIDGAEQAQIVRLRWWMKHTTGQHLGRIEGGGQLPLI
ncbi:TPA: hypothetical protein LU109_003541 [Enterobacter hormaechei subsp. xiangfangensis]|nr:hypothetical protein [Enterobacter hormaechei subsp. xiangfangensis]